MTVSIRTKKLPNEKSFKAIFEAPETKIEKLFSTHLDEKDREVNLARSSGLEVAACSAKDLNSFILYLEKEGKEVRIEKKTILEIINRN